MKYIKNMATILVVFMTLPVLAQSDLPKPGITPDSPFYFMDRRFDVFQSAESLADERASEMVAMAEIAHESGLAKATVGYEKAMEKRQQQAEENEEAAEEVVRQSTNHLAVLASVREQVPDQAKAGIDIALNKSAQGRENALDTLRRQNPERASAVAEETLEDLIVNTPEGAQEGLQHALESVREGNDTVQPVQGAPEGQASDFPTNRN